MATEHVTIRINKKLAEQLKQIQISEKWTSKTALYEHALKSYVEGKTNEIDFALIDNAMTKILQRNFRKLDERFSRLQVRGLLEMGQTKRLLSSLLADKYGGEAVRDFNKKAWAAAVKDTKKPLSELDEILEEIRTQEAAEKVEREAQVAPQKPMENS